MEDWNRVKVEIRMRRKAAKRTRNIGVCKTKVKVNYTLYTKTTATVFTKVNSSKYLTKSQGNTQGNIYVTLMTLSRRGAI